MGHARLLGHARLPGHAEVGTSAPESAPPHLRSERNISFGAECKERNMLKKMERNERCGTAKNNFRSSAPQNCGRLLCIQLFNKYNFVFEAIRENGHLGFRILHFNQ